MMLRDAPSSSVNIQATIAVVETKRCDIPEFSNLPKSFSGDVPICSDFTGFVELLDEEEILSGATDCCGGLARHNALPCTNEPVERRTSKIGRTGVTFQLQSGLSSRNLADL